MKYFILVLICFAFFMACSSNDEVAVEQEEMEQMEEDNPMPPSNFTIEVEPLFGYANVNWTNDVGGPNNLNLNYDLYLNNNLVISNLEDLNYTFENLNFDTEYQLKIIAKNAEAETAEESIFTTLKSPENYTFLLKEVQRTGSTIGEIFYYNYSYNEENQLIGRVDSDVDGFQFREYTVEYDNESRIKKEREINNIFGGICSENISYFYENNVLKTVTSSSFCGPHETTITLDRISQIEYTYHFKQDDWKGGNSYEYDAIVNLEFNNEGLPITHTLTLVGANSGYVTEFDYTDGNMTRINGGGNNMQFVFDNQNSRHALGSGNYGMIGKNNRLSMGTPFNGLHLNTALIDFENKNNIVKSISEGGTAEYLYTYTPFGYPETLTISSNKVFSYSYIFVEN
ncbi:MAG: hypothetical protein CMC70_05960 [Flavobacteriaceae bacterium]|nr:hypothetical protein [Flavobacteriaceae bacterium]